MSVRVECGRRMSTSCPHEVRASATTAGMTSFSYFSSTMKHSRVGRVSAGPVTVCITVEIELRVPVPCLPGPDIQPTYSCDSAGDVADWFDCALAARSQVGTPGVGGTRRGCGWTPPRWAPATLGEEGTTREVLA